MGLARYHAARNRFLETGLIADRERMERAATPAVLRELDRIEERAEAYRREQQRLLAQEAEGVRRARRQALAAVIRTAGIIIAVVAAIISIAVMAAPHFREEHPPPGEQLQVENPEHCFGGYPPGTVTVYENGMPWTKFRVGGAAGAHLCLPLDMLYIFVPDYVK